MLNFMSIKLRNKERQPLQLSFFQHLTRFFISTKNSIPKWLGLTSKKPFTGIKFLAYLLEILTSSGMEKKMSKVGKTFCGIPPLYKYTA